MFSAMSTCRNIDDCEGHSCGSNGRCVDGINDYSCECESGFEEEMVAGEKMCGNINDCGPNACGPHGACHDLVNGYSCECDTGYPLQGEGDDQLCVAQVCQIPAAANTIVTTTELTFPHTLFVECERGHETQYNKDHFMIMCNPEGETVYVGDENPQCAPKVCGHPPDVVAEHQEVRNYHFGETSVSVCAGGEVQITHECGADGVFTVTSQFSTCQNSCGQPTVPAHAHRSDGAGAVMHPNSATYTCDDGYTPLASGLPGQAFSQACRATGAFEALTQSCVPVVCQRPAAPQNWEWVSENALNTQSPAYLRCASGTTSMQAGADGRFQCTCNANGQISQLPAACVAEQFVITGRVRDATRPTQGVPSATLVIAGQTITTDAGGHYSVTLPAGQHSYSLNAHNYITIPSGRMTVTAAGTFDISMSSSLAADEWRLVLTWDQNPRDLDSHLQFFGEESRCPEMYYGRRSASCDGVRASLDVDDVSSWGPETTTLSGVNSCSGPWWNPSSATCKWVYKVKNYSGYYDRNHGWQHSQATVTVYNGDSLVRELEVNANHGHRQDDGVGSPSYWSVVSIDAHGNLQECTNHNCD